MNRNLSLILAQFGITEFNATPLALGYANENFRIDSDGKTMMLRLCKQQSVTSISKEMELMEILRNHNLKVAYPIANNAGEFIIQLGEFPAVMYDFVEGGDAPLNAESRTQIGVELAKLNSIKVPLGFRKTNNLNFQKCLELAKKFDSAPNQFPAVFEHFQSELVLLEKHINQDLPTGFIHGDLFPNNAIFEGNDLSALIDFEEFAVEKLLFDVAMTMMGFCLDDEFKIDVRAQSEFLDAYESVRPLSQSEKAALPYFIKWAALAMMSWHLENDLLQTPDSKQEKRVIELMKIGQNVEVD